MPRNAAPLIPLATLAYIRVSTDKQEEIGLGLDVQRDGILAYATLHGLHIDGWQQDVESGAKEGRAGLNAMRAAINAGGVARLLCYRLDRLARDVLLSETLPREFAACGCRVISVSEAIDDTPSGHLMRTILAGFAQYERAVIALRTTSGRRAKVASSGTFAGGIAPYGYQAVGSRNVPGCGQLVIETRQAEAVRTIFALDKARMTQQAIAKRLNEEGYVTAEGAAFSQAHISRILKRRAVYEATVATSTSIVLQDGVAPQQPAILD